MGDNKPKKKKKAREAKSLAFPRRDKMMKHPSIQK